MTHAHLQLVPIDPSRLSRWREGAERLGDIALGLQGELAELAKDATRHRLQRAARAARWAEKHLTGNAALIANAIGTELENDDSPVIGARPSAGCSASTPQRADG